MRSTHERVVGSIVHRDRRWLIVACNVLLIGASLVGAFLLRFEFQISESDRVVLARALLVVVPVKLLVFQLSGLNRGWWRYVGIEDIILLFRSNCLASLAIFLTVSPLAGQRLPYSVSCIDLVLCFLATATARFAIRLYREAVALDLGKEGRSRILVYGAGSAGSKLVREIRTDPTLDYEVLGFLDDDPLKHSLTLNGVPVLGAGRDAARIIERLKRENRGIDQFVIAMPSATGRQMQEALAHCRSAGLPCKTLPSLSELLTGSFESAQLRDLRIEDLLGREPVQIEEGRIQQSLFQRSVLVTGAAGSIGSELCRQIAKFKPRRLVIFDQSESPLFEIDNELRRHFPGVDIAAELGDIRNRARLDDVMRCHRTEAVFHAAAYKHVPMLEGCPFEAIRNNVFGTWNLIEATQEHAVKSFVMISSDKAVNPTSMMGLTKRVTELMVAAMPRHTTKFVSVRFGNVLGSNGSVVPLFRAQIAAGGPVTITHPEMRRYFMTVQEAVQLVLLASTQGEGSEIFVLDMGEPVRIMDLAQTMIGIAGHTPHEDIELRVVGSRPGERLFEPLFSETETLGSTQHRKINVLQSRTPELELVQNWLSELQRIVSREDLPSTVAHLALLVPEYQPEPIWPKQQSAEIKPVKQPARTQLVTDLVPRRA